ncbi:MAG: membrane protein insertion efficiency factor YidD [Rhodospirillales bacterium]
MSRSLPRRLARIPVLIYSYGLSPILPGTCRFHPTCSAYALEAIDRFGALKGSWLALRRLARCHPLGGHGIDPVPDQLDGWRPVHDDVKDRG